MSSHKCNMCGLWYGDSDLLDDPELGFLCKNCAVSLRELEEEEKAQKEGEKDEEEYQASESRRKKKELEDLKEEERKCKALP